MTDQRIWEALQSITEGTGWPPAAVIDAVAMEHKLDRERVAQVWRERSFSVGAG